MAYLDLSTFTKFNLSYTVTVNGDATISPMTGSPFASGSLDLDGTGDYLSIPDNNDWNRSANFTIDFWVYINSHDSDISGFCGQGGNATSSRWRLRYYNSNLEYEAYNAGVQNVLMQRSWSPSLTTWYHVALVRNGNDYYMFIDGTQIGTTYTDSDALGNTSATMDVGRCYDAGGYKYLNGYMNEFRFSNGLARWTPQTGQDFTPSSTFYLTDANTALLLHLTEDTKDYSRDFVYISDNSLTGSNNEKATFIDLPYIDGSYLYKDFGVGYFKNFEILFNFQITDQETSGSEIILFKLANTLVTNYSNSQAIYTDAQTDISKFKISIASPGYIATTVNTYNINTTYYIRALRSNTMFGIEIYNSASDRENKTNILEKVIFTEGVTGDTTAWRYFYTIVCRGDSGGGVTVSGYTENFDIVSADHDLGTALSDFIDQGDTIYVDQSGNIHVCGHRYISAGIIYYQVSTDGGNTFTDGEGGGSGSVKSWTLPDNSYPDSTAIVVDSEENIYLFYHRRYDIYMLKKTAGTAPTWGSAVNISNNGNIIAYSLRAEVDSNDNLLVIQSGWWSGRSDGLGAYSSDDGGTTWTEEFGDWDDAYKFSDLTIDQNDDGWCVHFTDYGGWDVEVHKLDRNPATAGYSWDWLGAYNGLSSTVVYGSAIIAERNTNNIWEFISIVDGSNYKLQYSKYNGTSWSAWTTILQKSTSDNKRYYNLSVVRTYENEIYLTYNLYDGTNNIPPVYLVRYNGTTWETPVVFKEEGVKCSLQQPNLSSGASKIYYVYEHYLNISNFLDSFSISRLLSYDTITLSDNIIVNLSLEKAILSEGLTLSDQIFLNLSLEKLILNDIITLSDSISFSPNLYLGDVISLSDSIYLNSPQLNLYLEDTITLTDVFQIKQSLFLADTITLSDKIRGVLNAPFTSQIVYGNSPYLILVSDSDPVRVTKIDISGSIPDWEIFYLNDTGETFKNAKSVCVNASFDTIYVACAEGKIVKLNLNDLNDREEIVLETGTSANDMMYIDCLDDWTYTYIASNDTLGELITLDESTIKKLNADFRFLKQITKQISGFVNTIFAKKCNSKFNFITTKTKVLHSDLRFIKFEYSEIGLQPVYARTDFHVYINSVERTDVDLASIVISMVDGNYTTASFRLAVKHDTYVPSASTEIVVKLKTETIFSGKVSAISCDGQGENLTITARTTSVNAETFRTVNLALASENQNRHLYDIVLDDINIDTPEPDSGDEDEPTQNKPNYRGVKINLGISIQEHCSKFESGWSSDDLADSVKAGLWQPLQNYTYFWFASGYDYGRKRSFSDEYIGTSPAGLSSGLIEITSLRYYAQRIWDDSRLPLGYYTLGSSPYLEVSAPNGRLIPSLRYVDEEDGLYVEQRAGYYLVNHAKAVANAEYQSLKGTRGIFSNMVGQPIDIGSARKTTAKVSLTIDAYLYYRLGLGTNINITNTIVPNIFNNTNGFPLGIKNIEINSDDMLVHITTDDTMSVTQVRSLYVSSAGYYGNDPEEVVNRGITTAPIRNRIRRKYNPATGGYVG